MRARGRSDWLPSPGSCKPRCSVAPMSRIASVMVGNRCRFNARRSTLALSAFLGSAAVCRAASGPIGRPAASRPVQSRAIGVARSRFRAGDESRAELRRNGNGTGIERRRRLVRVGRDATPSDDRARPRKRPSIRCGRARNCLAGPVRGDDCGRLRLALRVVLREGGWCPGADSNHRHCDFQSHALPTELPGPGPCGAVAVTSEWGL